jgi:hypothetical protein
MKRNSKLSIALLTLFMAVSLNLQAQFMKKLGDKLSGGKEKETAESAKAEPEKGKDLNEWHKAHEGQVVFYNQAIVYESSSSDDSDYKMLSERVLGGSGAFSFRAYLGKSFKSFPNCDGFDIRYTIGTESITTSQLRKDMPEYYARMASNYSFWDFDNATVGVPLDSDAGKYWDMYTLQEDAYRILLSRAKDELSNGASVIMKVEIIGTKDDVANDVVMASGEITLKVTSESSNLQSLNCRCGKAGMTDAAVIKEVIDAFEFQFSDIKEVYHVILLDRDFTLNYDDSYPTKLVTSKGMWANIVYQKADGIYMMVKRYIFFKKSGAGFSDKVTIGNQSFYLPVSPTCSL